MGSPDTWSVKFYNIHVYFIEVRYLFLVAIVNPLRARVYRPFQGGAFFVDPFCYLCFVLVFVMPSCLFIVVVCWEGLPLDSLVYGVCLCFVAFPCGVPGQVCCLFVSIPDLCLILYFE